MRQREIASLQPVLRNISHLAIWDDHDFGLNDHHNTNPIKDKALDVFKRVWANPGYGIQAAPGVFFKYQYGNVDFFFVDCRYYRDPNELKDSPQKTMLGKEQFQWLTGELKKSTAIFKLVLSGSGWSKAKGPGGDSWASFLYERDRLFGFIKENQVEGVVLLSGDTHVGELNAIPWSEQGGYDLYDLVSSPLAQPTTDSWLVRKPEKRIRDVYFKGPNYGLIEFYLEEERPHLKFSLKNPKNEVVMNPFILYADELKNGVGSWQRK